MFERPQEFRRLAQLPPRRQTPPVQAERQLVVTSQPGDVSQARYRMSDGVLGSGLLAQRKSLFVKRARQLVIAFASRHTAQTIEGDGDLASPSELAMNGEALCEGCARGRTVLGDETKRQE